MGVAGLFSATKFLVRPVADFLGERLVCLPKVCSGAMLHAALKRLDPTIPFVGQSAMNGLVEATRSKVGLNARVDGLLTMLVKPRKQFFQLLRCKRSYRAFDFLDRI
jgi:hypothetical protein